MGGEADRDWVCLGVVRAAVGVRGDVRIGTYTAEARAISDYGPLRVGLDGPDLRLRVVRSQGDVVVGRFEGFADRTEVERLKGKLLYVLRSRLPAPDEDSYYHHDLVGLAVQDETGATVGRVRAVHNFGAGDLVEVARSDGDNAMVPFTRAAIPVVDLAGGRIVLAPGTDLA